MEYVFFSLSFLLLGVLLGLIVGFLAAAFVFVNLIKTGELETILHKSPKSA